MSINILKNIYKNKKSFKFECENFIKALKFYLLVLYFRTCKPFVLLILIKLNWKGSGFNLNGEVLVFSTIF